MVSPLIVQCPVPTCETLVHAEGNWLVRYSARRPRLAICCQRLSVCEKQGIALTYIQPSKPQQNAYVELYNLTVRHEWLDLYIFETIEVVQQVATEWLWTYNNERPNMGICGATLAMKLKIARVSSTVAPR